MHVKVQAPCTTTCLLSRRHHLNVYNRPTRPPINQPTHPAHPSCSNRFSLSQHLACPLYTPGSLVGCTALPGPVSCNQQNPTLFTPQQPFNKPQQTLQHTLRKTHQHTPLLTYCCCSHAQRRAHYHIATTSTSYSPIVQPTQPPQSSPNKLDM